MAKKTQTKTTEVIPVNAQAKDTFFKKVYEKEERQRALAAFLLGISSEKISTATVRPVLFGNKENDFACMCDDVVYILTEEQSSGSPNLPYRLLEYATTGLRSMVDSEQLLYGKKRVYFPIPKLYVLQVGLEAKAANLPEQVQYDIRLSDSFLSAAEKYGENAPTPDLEAVVHVYDFRMTLEEIFHYIEDAVLPDRFAAYDNDMRNYALVANGITYMQRCGRHDEYPVPANVATVAEFLKLMLERSIFVDLLTDKEVCDMTMAQFSRDDILLYQGLERGIEQGLERGIQQGLEQGLERGICSFILDKVEDGVAEHIIIQKLQKHFMLDEETAKRYYNTYATLK